MYIFYPIVKQSIEPTSSFKCYDVLQSPRTALVYPLGSRCSRWWAWAKRWAPEVGTMGRYLKGPFPLGSVLCTYEQPLEIQYNTTQTDGAGGENPLAGMFLWGIFGPWQGSAAEHWVVAGGCWAVQAVQCVPYSSVQSSGRKKQLRLPSRLLRPHPRC